MVVAYARVRHIPMEKTFHCFVWFLVIKQDWPIDHFDPANLERFKKNKNMTQ